MLTRTIKIEVEVDITYPYRATRRIKLSHPELSGALILDVEDDGEMDMDDAVEAAIDRITLEEPEPEIIQVPAITNPETKSVGVSQAPVGDVANSVATIIDRVSRIREMLKK